MKNENVENNNPVGCVYKIKCESENKCYIGATTQGFENRMKNHANLLLKNRHHNKKLQKDFNLYSSSDFKGYVIDLAYTTKGLKYLEYMYTKSFKRIKKSYNSQIALGSMFNLDVSKLSENNNINDKIGDMYYFNKWDPDFIGPMKENNLGEDTLILETGKNFPNIFEELSKS